MIQSVKFFCFAYLLLAVLPACGEPQSLVGHVLDVRIGPERGTIDARDRLNLPPRGRGRRSPSGTTAYRFVGASPSPRTTST
jgi:hypothetical protein